MVCNGMIRTGAQLQSSQRAFEAGHYREVVESLSTRKSLKPAEAAALISSLAFLGQSEDAHTYWKLHRKKMKRAEKMLCRFSLGVAATRVSRHKTALPLFERNLRDAEKAKSSACYAYQGIGFYFYFIGRFHHAKKWAEKASIAALKSQNKYIRYLAMDLLGHCTVQMGEREKGLRLMHQAGELAKAHGNDNLSSAFRVASLIYEAEAGWRPHTIVAEIESALQASSVEDSYTKSNLWLELSRQLTLRGEWQKARELLNQNSAAIYAYGNRRHELILQTRLAEIAFCQGDTFTADHFVRSARRCLDNVADRAYELRVLGLEFKSHQLAQREVPAEIKTRLQELTRTYSSHINKQILFRQGLVAETRIPHSEDPIHHLFLLEQKNSSEAAQAALELGYLGLWQRFSALKAGEKHFVALDGGRVVLVSSPHGVKRMSGALTRQYLRLLSVMNEGATNKENLIRRVWGYEYDPARHDPLLHSTIAKMRKSLEPHADWIITTESGWSLHPQVNWRLEKTEREAPTPEISDAAPMPIDSSLNFRQLQVLQEGNMWSISLYKKRFNVSTMTAFRDLTSLIEMKYLIRTGQGRATRYHLAQQKD